jgi:hypothetical protein
MEKYKFENGFEIKVFSIPELQKMSYSDYDNETITRDDLYYSTIVDMWRFVGYKNDIDDMMHEMKGNMNWVYEWTWTAEQKSEFIHIFHKIYMDILSIDSDESLKEIEIWAGFGPSFSLDDQSEENYKKYNELMKDIETDIEL